MRDAGDKYEEAEKRLQEQLREMKEQLDMAQRVLHMFHMLTIHTGSNMCLCTVPFWD